ncbi:cytochrome P450 [Xylogone sp. PMI_703]|nr:cytochrome P450 [Xylogone sp. PMI_703]
MLEAIVALLSWRVLLPLCGLFLAFRIIRGKRIQQRKVLRLGSYAPKVPSWLPLGIDTMISGFYNHVTHQDRKFYDSLLKYGASPQSPTVELHMLGHRVIFTADRENLRAVLATQFSDFGKGEGFRQDWHGILGDSVFSLDGANWHSARQLLRPQFIRDRISDLMIFEKYSETMLRGFAGGEEGITNPDVGRRGVGKVVNVTSFIHRFTLDTSTDFLFGKSVGSLENIDNEFGEAFETAEHELSARTRAGPAKSLLSTKKLDHALKVINDIAFPYIDAALALDASELASKSTDQSYTFLHALASVSRDRIFLRDQIVSLLLAGRDTTAAILVWILYELARHPDIYAKLRTEVLNTVGPTAMPTYTNLKDMKYLQAVINETVRIYPLPYNVRVALKDTTLPRGGGPDGSLPVGIPAGTGVSFSTYNLHHNPDFYPSPEEDPDFPPMEQFVPDRWLTWHPKPWTFIPFSGGPRICLGQQFALAEMGYTLVKISQRFSRMAWVGEGEGISKVKANIMIEPLDDVMLRFWD